MPGRDLNAEIIRSFPVNLDNMDTQNTEKLNDYCADLMKELQANYKNQNDWDLVSHTFKFDHLGIGKTFKACLDGDCIKGFNSPEKRPEYVKFRLD